jgi:hypothetical protein
MVGPQQFQRQPRSLKKRPLAHEHDVPRLDMTYELKQIRDLNDLLKA